MAIKRPICLPRAFLKFVVPAFVSYTVSLLAFILIAKEKMGAGVDSWLPLARPITHAFYRSMSAMFNG